MDSDKIKLAEERRRRVIAHSEARLKKIMDLTKVESKPSPENDFVEFEVDSFINESKKQSTSSDLPDCSTRLNSNSPPVPKAQNVNKNGIAPNGHLFRSSSDVAETVADFERSDQAYLMQNATFGSNPFMFPHSHSSPMLGRFGDQSLRNGLGSNRVSPEDFNLLLNTLTNYAVPSSQNQPSDLGGLLATLASLSSGTGVPSAPQRDASPEEPTPEHPIRKPHLSIIVFLILGVAIRIIFQFYTPHVNVFTPFLCLAVPLFIMSWGRANTPLTGMLTTVFLFVRNPRSQALILNWVRITTLLRGLSRLFAFYLFSFVVTHVLFELRSISYDINNYSVLTH